MPHKDPAKRKAYQAAYRKAHVPARRKSYKKYYDKHAKEIYARKTPYGELSPEKKETAREIARASAKRAYDRDPEANRKQTRKWRLTHPEWNLWYGAKRRAKKLGLVFDLQVSDIVIPKRCPLLPEIVLRVREGTAKGGAGPNSPTLDRIDSSKGYTKDNVWVISWRANKLKSDATLEELERLVSNLRAKQFSFTGS